MVFSNTRIYSADFIGRLVNGKKKKSKTQTMPEMVLSRFKQITTQTHTQPSGRETISGPTCHQLWFPFTQGLVFISSSLFIPPVSYFA